VACRAVFEASRLPAAFDEPLHAVTGVTHGDDYRWRTCLRYAPATGNPPADAPYSHWRRLTGGAGIGGIRTVSVQEPGGSVPLASGIVMPGALWRRR
jgi:hypothetical protein